MSINLDTQIRQSLASEITLRTFRTPSPYEVPGSSGHYFGWGVGAEGGVNIQTEGGGNAGIWAIPILTTPIYNPERDIWSCSLLWRIRVTLWGEYRPPFEYDLWHDEHEIQVATFEFSNEEYIAHGYTLPESVTYDISTTITVQFGSQFAVYGEIEALSTENRDYIWRIYKYDQDPYGQPPQALRMRLQPAGTANVYATCANRSWDLDVDAQFLGISNEQWQSTMRNGLRPMYCEAHGLSTGEVPYESLTQMAYGRLIFGLSSHGDTVITNDDISRCEFDSRTGAFAIFLLAGGRAGVNLEVPPYTKTYALQAEYIDGSRGHQQTKWMTLESTSPAIGDTCSIPINCRGRYLVWTTNDSADVDDIGSQTIGNDGLLYAMSGAHIINCAVIDEPDFPATNQPPDPPNWHRDARVLLRPPLIDPTWSNALQLSFVSSGIDIISEFRTTDGWTVDPPGAATLSLDADGYLRVSVSAACLIRRNVLYEIGGLRLFSLNYAASGTTQPVNIGLNSYTYEACESAPRQYDVCAANVSDQADTNQHIMVNGAHSWGLTGAGWSLTLLTIANLQPNATYTFRGLSFNRTSTPTMTVHIYADEGAYVGAQAGDDRTSDAYSLYQSDNTCINRRGVIFVDGLLVGEIWGMRHTRIEQGGEVRWQHAPTKLGDTILMTRTSNLVYATTSQGAWRSPELPTDYLVGGTYYGGSTVTIPAMLVYEQVWMPFSIVRGTTFYGTKIYRGGIYVRIIDERHTPPANIDVICYQRNGINGPILRTFTAQTNSLGIAAFRAMQQPTINAYYCYDVYVAGGSRNGGGGGQESDNLKYDANTGCLLHVPTGALAYRCPSAPGTGELLEARGTITTRNRAFGYIALKRRWAG